MLAVEVKNVVKSYAAKAAVADLSFSVARNEVFGLIGPNGAGKTTTIRMMMDLVKPDSGEVRVLDEPLTEATKAKLGYLPEERGLYRELSVIDSIVYLASLKGMAKRAAEERADELLRQTGMLPQKHKRVEALSKGMAQIVQLIVTIVHDPELVILDEPFAGLDPVNTELVKELLVGMRDQGKTVILSTHQMNQVEEVCDRILMISEGRAVLYGGLAEVKSRYSSHSVIVEVVGEMPEISGVRERRPGRGYVELALDTQTAPQEVLGRLVAAGVEVRRFEVATPSLTEIFLQAVSRSDE